MTYVVLHSFDSPTEISPEKFAAMAPHLRGELVRLLLEHGRTRNFIARELGIDPDKIDHYRTARDRFCLPGEKPEAAPGLSLGHDRRGAPKGAAGLPPVSAALLKSMRDEGGLTACSRLDLAGRLDCHETSIATAFKRLLALGLIEQVRLGGPGKGKATVWRLTSAGLETAAEIDAAIAARVAGHA